MGAEAILGPAIWLANAAVGRHLGACLDIDAPSQKVSRSTPGFSVQVGVGRCLGLLGRIILIVHDRKAARKRIDSIHGAA